MADPKHNGARADTPAGRPVRLSLDSWDAVRDMAQTWLADGAWRQAFRLVLASRLRQPKDESARFMREEFRDFPVRFVLAMVQGIGNMVMLTPTVRALKEMFPRSEIELVGHSPALQVMDGWDAVAACTELEDFDPSRERDAVLLTIWSGQFQKAFPALVTSGDVPAVRVEFSTWLRHEAEFHLDLARVLGHEGAMPGPYCVQRKTALPFDPGRPVALLSDTSNPEPDWQRKRWPRFRALAERLIEDGYQVALIGGPAEAQEFDPANWPEGVLNLLGRYSIAETAYLIGEAGLLIANDSGPAHIGAAVGAETHVLFGPTRESKNLPLGPKVRPVSVEIGCRPCQYLPSWGDCERHRCMELITVDRVMASLAGTAEAGRDAKAVWAPADSVPSVKVDLGCGRFKRKGFIGIDCDPGSGADVVCDVTEGIPLATDSVDCLAADNLLEHIGDDLQHVMAEIWRVCKPEARIEISVPLFPSDKALADPTHRRYFTEDSFSYFDATDRHWREFGRSYGFPPFRIRARHKLAGELEVIISPVKRAAGSAARPPAKSRPSICFISHNQPGAGGAEIALHNVANGLTRLGYDVTAVHNRTPFIHKTPVEAPPDAEYRLLWLEASDLPVFHRKSAELVPSLSKRAEVCMPLWRAASPGLVAACQEHGMSAGIWCQNVNYPPERGNRSIFRLADFVVAVTPYALPLLKRRFSREENVYVIPNACSGVFFDSYRDRLLDEVTRFVFFGRLADEQKGLMCLCDALARVKEKDRPFTLDIIGTGPDEEAMRSRIGSLGLGEQTRFLGWRRPEEVARMLPGYHLCILPSNFEGCSLAAVETMAAGVPIITTPVGGTPWLIVDKKHGLLVPPRSAGRLARAILWACDHPAEMSLMARWAHKKALKRYHWDRVVGDFQRLLDRVRPARMQPAAGASAKRTAG